MVRSPSNTRAMNKPTGLVTSRIAPKNARIWKMPALVIAASESFGLEHRPAEIHEQQERDDAGHEIVEHDRFLRAIERLGDRPQQQETDRVHGQVGEVKHRADP